MNKTVFIMDSSGNAVQWAAGMSLEAMTVRGEVWIQTSPSAYTVHTADPRLCVQKFVQSLCLCPDGSLLMWDEDEQKVVCGGWREEEKAEKSVSSATEGWRELGRSEIIQSCDVFDSKGVFATRSPASVFVGKDVAYLAMKSESAELKVWRKEPQP